MKGDFAGWIVRYSLVPLFTLTFPASVHVVLRVFMFFIACMNIFHSSFNASFKKLFFNAIVSELIPGISFEQMLYGMKNTENTTQKQKAHLQGCSNY